MCPGIETVAQPFAERYFEFKFSAGTKMASNDPDECEAGLLGAEDASEEASAPVALCRRGSAALGLLVLLALLAMGGHRSLRLHPHLEANVEDFVREFSMPEGAGVNLGGWFVLEDWFFSGSSGKLVSSEHREGQGRCLPPLLHHVNEPWPSEGVLAFRLNASMGTKQTTRIFQAHREEFFQKEELQEIVRSGIDTIRLPLTWAAFADALAPLSPSVYAAHNPDTEARHSQS